MSTATDHPDMSEVSITDVMNALRDPVRLRIVRLAADNDALPCKAFTDAIPKSTLSHHWKVLREAGLIRQTPDGTRKLNSLRKEELDRRFPGLLDAVLEAAEEVEPLPGEAC